MNIDGMIERWISLGKISINEPLMNVKNNQWMKTKRIKIIKLNKMNIMNKINPIIWNYFDGWMCFHHWKIMWMKIIVINENMYRRDEIQCVKFKCNGLNCYEWKWPFYSTYI
jgi:hypothetical protein